jgi:hypothetical protein
MTTPPKPFTPRLILQMLLFIVIIPFLPLLISWHWGWWEGWVYAAIGILGFALSRALLPPPSGSDQSVPVWRAAG